MIDGPIASKQRGGGEIPDAGHTSAFTVSLPLLRLWTAQMDSD